MGRGSFKKGSTSVLLSSAILEGAILCLFFAFSFVLGLFFFFYASYSSFPFPISPLVLSSLILQWLQIYPESLKVARSLLVLQRTTVPRQSNHSHCRYLPSGINQLNARLLEASLSLKPILLASFAFLFFFLPPDVFEGKQLSG